MSSVLKRTEGCSSVRRRQFELRSAPEGIAKAGRAVSDRAAARFCEALIMFARTKTLVAGCFLVVGGAAGILASQNNADTSNWTIKINETRGPVRAGSIPPSGNTA